MAWGFKLLTDTPGPQTRLREALYEAHPEALEQKRVPTLAEIEGHSIPYLDAVAEEILRLSHAVLIVDRQASEDTVVLGQHIPKGTTIMITNMGPSFTEPACEIDESLRSESSQAAGRDSKNPLRWDDEGIDEFKPERWLADDPETGRKVFNPKAGPVLPFGGGLRFCFGRKVAYLEIKMIVTLVVWTFELCRCPETLSSYQSYEALTRRPTQFYLSLKELEY